MAFFQTKHLRIHDVDDDIAVLVLNRDQSPINILDAALLDDVERAIDALAKANQHRLLVILSGKSKNFCHGPAPAVLVNWKKEDFASWAERGQRVCVQLADLAIPSTCV